MASSTCLEGLADAIKLLAEKCYNELQVDNGNELLLSSQGVCQKLLDQIEKKDLAAQDCLQGYAQACLDFTYVDENQLVQEEFSKPNTDDRIRQVFEQFDVVLTLAAEQLTSQKLIDLLTPDLYECILWRKGALLYMYCSCVERDSDRQKDDHFVKALENGVQFLQDMLKVRVPVTEEEVVFNDIETLQLLQNGLFSDVHVLALMYCGEMCYWYQKHCKPETSSNFNATAIGVKLLQDYVNAIGGPLKDKGWNCERAKELLTSLQDT